MFHNSNTNDPQDGQYDLTPLDTKTSSNTVDESEHCPPPTPSYSIDPWEVMSPTEKEAEENEDYFRTASGPK